MLTSQNEDLNTTLQRLFPYLEQYLTDMGTQLSNNKKCICFRPDHSESVASCSLIAPDYIIYHCFGCGSSGNILHAANAIENKPLHGPGFITQNVKYLCDRYGIECPDIELTSLEELEIKTQIVYGAAANLLRKEGHTDLAEKRNWSPTLCKRLGIGTIPDWNIYRDKLLSLTQVDKNTLKKLGIIQNLFNPNVLTFTIQDHYGMVVGFAARTNTIPKYVNTGKTCPIYFKNKILYGLNRTDKENYIEITEGYGDVVTANNVGINNIAAVCGTGFNIEQISILAQLGIKNIVLAFDYDKPQKVNNGYRCPGTIATIDIIDKIVKNNTDLRIRILDWEPTLKQLKEIPENPKDWDSSYESSIDVGYFINKYGREEYLKIPRISAFSWRLKQFPQDEDTTVIAEFMCRFISNESSPIHRDKLSLELAAYTNINKESIIQYVEELIKSKDTKLKTYQNKQLKLFQQKWDITDNIERIHLVERLEQSLIDSTNYNIIPNTISILERTKELWAQQDIPADKTTGWNTGYTLLNKTFGEGIPKKESLIGLGGLENIGKTSILSQIALNILKLNVDVKLIFMTIDDSFDKLISKLIAADTGIILNHLAHPKKFIKNINKLKALSECRKQIEHWIQNGNLEIHDRQDGKTVGYIRRILEHQRRNYDGNILFILDSFHKISQQNTDRRLHFINISDEFMTMASKFQTTFLYTMELRKLFNRTQRPTINDLAESAQMAYDSKCVMIMHQDLHVNRDTDKYWIDPTVDPNDPAQALKSKKPIVELIIEKNKISDFKGTINYEFDPIRAKFTELQIINTNLHGQTGLANTQINNTLNGQFPNKRLSFMSDEERSKFQ